VPEQRLPTEIASLQTEVLQHRANLFDPETGLPTLPVVVERVRRLLEDSGSVPVLLVRPEQETNLEHVVGWERYDRLLRRLADHLLVELAGTRGIVCQESVRSDVFMVFVGDGAHIDLVNRLRQGFEPHDGDDGPFPLRFGEGRIRRRPTQRIERCIYTGILEARSDFYRRGEALDELRRDELRRILADRTVTTLFQPILQVPSRSIIGHEALSRGPAGSYLEPAENLFGFAERAGLLGEIERMCLEQALVAARRLPSPATVFLNLSIHGLEQLEAGTGGLVNTVEAAGWLPRDVVLEITERTYADSPLRLRSRVAALRQQGFRVAIDDMGTGYSSLHVLAELQPDFIKLDQMLVRGLPDEPIKRNLVAAIIGFAASSQSVVIAEGVERPDEADVLQRLGVHLLQGFHFAYPATV